MTISLGVKRIARILANILRIILPDGKMIALTPKGFLSEEEFSGVGRGLGPVGDDGLHVGLSPHGEAHYDRNQGEAGGGKAILHARGHFDRGACCHSAR